MFSNRIELFSILGFRVSVDLSWIILAVLITWSLATGYFPRIIDGVSPVAAWWLGAAGAVGLFASIILHEFAHSWIARQFDMPIRGITLFIFGGVAEMEDEPPSARAEFFMAIAGPLMSYALALLFYGLSGLLPVEMLAALLTYLATINTMLATFNLIPAFPLDGGRVFRAALWWKTNDYAKATRIAASLGRFFGMVLIMSGVLSLVAGNPIAGIWQGLIGFFIIAVANSSEFQMTLKTGFEDKTVGQIMVRDPVSIPADTPLEDVIEDYFYRRHHRVFPVVRGSTLLGCIRVEDVGRIAREEWAQKTAGDVLPTAGKIGTVTPETPVMEALKRMRELETSRLMVAKNGELRGMLTLRDIMSYLTIRQELNASGRQHRSA
ncbi:site-2 protease family protein [Thalassovita aquimarina]|uniref:Zinc metalloprotease n=1 Tax=Thalassovita aquimarina TaxID=2785917 RepID=A0ABS5HNR6_9RHOB|nr:site-2 protease family protein [Thalassovita aquimarina]